MNALMENDPQSFKDVTIVIKSEEKEDKTRETHKQAEDQLQHQRIEPLTPHKYQLHFTNIYYYNINIYIINYYTRPNFSLL